MKGFDKLTDAITPKPTIVPVADPISLKTKANPSPELYVRVARLHERTGKPAEAAQNYRKALEIRSDYLGALLGYARLKDRTGDLGGADRLYQQAAKAHPKEATVFNNIGLFQIRHRMLDKAADSLTHAVRLQPKNTKYRNNLATLLVEKKRYKDAFMHLQVVHGEAIAYYNLGFLLEKKGDTRAAALHYAVAARKNPSLVEAGQALGRLQSVVRRTQTPPAGPARTEWSANPVQTRPPMHQGRPARSPALPSRQATLPPSRQVATPPPRQSWPPTRRYVPLPPAPDRPGLDVRQLPPAPSEQEQIGMGPPRPPIRYQPQRLPPTSNRSSGYPGVAPLPQRLYQPPPINSAPLPPPYRPGTPR